MWTAIGILAGLGLAAVLGRRARRRRIRRITRVVDEWNDSELGRTGPRPWGMKGDA